MNERTIEPNNAGKKLLTSKPGVKYPTRLNAIAFTTSKNSPKVKRVKGKVKITNRGLTIALTKPRNMAPIAAAVKPVISKPGTSQAVINREIAVASQVSKNCCISLK